MLARVLAMALCLSVCHKSVFCRSGSTNRAGFWHERFFRPVLHRVLRKFRYLQNKSTSLWNFSLNAGLEKISQRHVDRWTCYQLSSRKVDAQSVINWTVVGQLSWHYLPAPTLDRCSLSQRSPSSVSSTRPFFCIMYGIINNDIFTVIGITPGAAIKGHRN